ncbi:hypothetical protein PoB_007038200 [Plakobranchus ocellatus]|uniref:Uncharacterized protein n=1 Tax=Plakobranchus ocellatus TaxID=259542 RepID=A0AAV4DI14_9GAST|nr:hypothetical protein PoB_007038200 [Plakobranchus ocellatus]
MQATSAALNIGTVVGWFKQLVHQDVCPSYTIYNLPVQNEKARTNDLQDGKKNSYPLCLADDIDDLAWGNKELANLVKGLE